MTKLSAGLQDRSDKRLHGPDSLKSGGIRGPKNEQEYHGRFWKRPLSLKVYVYIHTHIFIRVYVATVYTYIYIYIYIHIYTYIYIYLRTPLRRLEPGASSSRAFFRKVVPWSMVLAQAAGIESSNQAPCFRGCLCLNRPAELCSGHKHATIFTYGDSNL